MPEQLGYRARFFRQALLYAERRPGPDQPLGRRQRLRCASRQFPCHRERRLSQFSIRNDLGR